MRIVHCVLARRAMRFRRADDGVAAVEFGLLLLPFLLMLMAIMELAMLMTTNSTVESALAMASREIKTGRVQSGEVSKSELFDTVCSFVQNVGDCSGKVFVEVRNFSNFAGYSSGSPACTDGAGEPPFEPGDAGDVVMMRICYVYDVMMPGIGLQLANLGENKRGIVVTSVFRNEPFGSILN